MRIKTQAFATGGIEETERKQEQRKNPETIVTLPREGGGTQKEVYELSIYEAGTSDRLRCR
ncbi:MAG: hypothetical protein QW338_05585 [Conexivisphaerales archaeon]